ncbi:hypothetical protein DdX_16610 [Ditylenchus destructor]|uniref:Uncharacterized protein n=1 Tax=Ditylenchus destructor TaxID=166010 RepID=A0AAD4MNN0_9BILA|nr:hypothetical protein DdX_16610 [Ditylenchus destructor]
MGPGGDLYQVPSLACQVAKLPSRWVYIKNLAPSCQVAKSPKFFRLGAKFAMIFEDELDLLGFNEEANDDNQATVKQFRERQYFELENFTERFRLTREQVQQLVDEIGDLIGPNGHMGKT